MADRRLERRVGRRRFLGSLACALVLPAAGCVDRTESEWVLADPPTDATLTDVVTTREGAYAVGEGGVVLRRDGGGWTTRLESGPAGGENGLRSADVTGNGRTVWFAGDGGALGAYDAVSDHVADFTAPRGMTSSWEAIAVAGLTGSERLFLVNSSGLFLRGTRDGSTLEWDALTEPATGSSVATLDVTPLEYAYFCDTNGGVYESSDAGESWERIGVEGASVDFYDVAAVDTGNVDVAGGDGTVYRYDGAAWSRRTVGEDPITAIVRDPYDALAVSAAGDVYERTFDGWTRLDGVDAGNELLSIALGTPRTPQVAVGESGTVLERRY